jgi:MFS family permease
LWLGQGTSLLGDQFAFIALPWLVLRLTNDPLALGITLALGGIPRALIMLIGGAIADRFPARAVMLASDIVRMLLVALMSVLVLTGAVQLWMVYALSFAFGLVDGFFMPASGSMMPRVVPPVDLPAGNSLFQGAAQLLNFVGPALAGGLIAWAGRPDGGSTGTVDLTGIGVALAIDALTFLVSIVTLWLMRGEAVTAAAKTAGADDGILGSIKAGFLYLWHDPAFRTLFLLMTTTNFLFVGTMSVGLPVLASIRLAEGAAAFGLIMGAYAAGNLLGYLVAGALPARRGIGLVTVAVLAGFGPATIGLGFITRTWEAFALLFVMGLGNGYLSIFLISWLQKRTRHDMLGRVMSLVMLSSLGLAPLSQALAGGIIKLSFVGLFLAVGVLIMLVAAWTATRPEIRNLEP